MFSIEEKAEHAADKFARRNRPFFELLTAPYTPSVDLKMFRKLVSNPLTMPDWDDDKVLALSREAFLYQDAASVFREFLSARLRLGSCVPIKWQRVIARVLDGEFQPNAKQSGRPVENQCERDVLAYELVTLLVNKFGLNIRNNASTGARTARTVPADACTIVARAFKEHGLGRPIGAASVKAAYDRERKKAANLS